MTSHNLEYEDDIVAQEKTNAENGQRPNAASPLTCPDCGGVLWELQDGELLRYRCHVGHAYSLDSLLVQQSETLERAMWAAVRAMEEKAILTRRLATHASHQNRPRSAEQFANRAAETEQNVYLLRQMVEHQQSLKVSQPPSGG